jgi:hypothetical protein
MQYLRTFNWPYTLACLGLSAAMASFAFQYLELDYLSSAIIGLAGWVGIVIATMIESEETQGKH